MHYDLRVIKNTDLFLNECLYFIDSLDGDRIGKKTIFFNDRNDLNER